MPQPDPETRLRSDENDQAQLCALAVHDVAADSIRGCVGIIEQTDDLLVNLIIQM